MATSVTLKPNAIDISGSTSGTTTLQASAVAGTTTLTLPAATDTLVGKATTDTLTNKTLTGAAMNGTLGATTPSAASVTTLTTSSTVTHSGGTANGVAYLDGSKVLTTGSALVFDGTNLGLGVTPSAAGVNYKTFQLYDLTSTNIAASSYGSNFVTNAYLNSGTWTRGGNTYAPAKYNQFNGAHIWSTAAAAGTTISWTDAMTLDASGNLLVGDTSAYSGSRLSVKTGNNNGTTHAWYAKNSSATVLGYQRDDGLFNTGAATNSPYNFTTASAANLFVDSSGTFYRSTSSLKYKTDVQDATHGLAEVLSLRPVTYRGKNDGETIFGGLIAEEVDAAGLTEFVQYAEDGTPDALAYGNMVSLCIKAIQQQQAIIQSLTARITALESA